MSGDSLLLNLNMSKIQFHIGLITISLVSACKTSAPPQQTVTEAQPLVEIGKEQFSIDDYQDSYNKNKFASDSTKALSPEEYLPLYTDLKIKVLQARSEGKDTTLDYREEIASYRDQLAKNHLVDKDLVEKLTTEAYDRLKQEVRASHILVGVSEDASPADTLEAHRAAIALRGRLEEGSDFADMASRFSKDPAAKTTRGDLGYFTAFQTLYPIETAAYTLPVGKISQPVRTKAGYHLIKVNDRRTNRGMVRVAHIMVTVDTAGTPAQKESAKTRIDEAYAQLQAGDEWNLVVEKFSDDRESRKNGGLLPLFGTGQMVPEIEEAAFALTRPQSYSKPVLTMYGWHIIRLIEKRPIETFANMAPALRKKVVTDSRGKVIEQANATRLRKKYALQEAPEQWKLVAALADSTLRTGKWDYQRAVSADWSTVTLFRIEQRPYDALSFLNYVKRKQTPRPKDASPEVVFRRHYTDYLTESLMEYERDHLEETNPEFRSLMNEIREGVLLSQIMEEQVWQRSLSDSTGQRSFYERNKERYNYPERALATIVTAKDTQTLNSVRKSLATSPYKLERKSKELLFPVNSVEIGNEQLDALTDLYIIMQKNADYVVEIAGYRSADEPEITSSTRVRNVVKYLNARNIPILRIIEKDYGSFRQSAEPERNRRVAFQFFSQSKSDVEKVYNADAPGAVTIREGYFPKSDPLLAGFKWQTGEQTANASGTFTWLNVAKIDPPRAKTFSEARGTVINDYQKELEKQWLARLQEKYPVKVNAQELEKVKR
ncbi:PpiC-type peptidyl-prolyl cis-trans isomerase [Dyadobacter fermentans DSM 18053]|uniref:PpiC-type peptidyl-prolyl cis-trans isomerase n=2 Tax=Dyadobacter fermentans TaxID=94254 RepID=C6W1I6_DYAFD|nr:PpiC-type peptidyl-prolyl cis-trans isomerase [Dyadobacter fermentans DSM 18053]